MLRFSIMSLSFYREVIDDFDLARRTFPNEKVLDLIGEACQLSEDDVIYDPLMFPSQMIDRLMNEKVMVVFIGLLCNYQCMFALEILIYPF